MEPASKPQTRKSQSASASAPRKRRKRTVVSGAADDCFTCAREGSSCDRRRPYCSQCLNQGRDCSGYKTTLTWGVGVASRGKFRGLSLPVTGAQPAPSSTNLRRPAAPKRLTEPKQLAVSPSTYEFTPFVPTTTGTHLPPQQQSPASETSENTPWAPSRLPDPQIWLNITKNDVPERRQWINPGLDHAESPKPMTSSSTILPNSGIGLSSHPQPPPRVPGNWTVDTWREPVQSSATVKQWPLPADGALEIQKMERRKEDGLEGDYSNGAPWIAEPSPSFSQLLLARSVGRTPRLRYLISYYAEVITPVIVAFDSPTNPFRTQILHLAQDSESLQEAIATLVTSNLRQRRERKTISTGRTLPSRVSSLAHRALTDGAFQDETPEEFAREEQYHRGMAVKSLNMELADPHRRLSDSVLATLFILCLFHICDTGVTQFKTQLAGVTKLLAIRMRSSPIMSDELKWFIRMFTWYDAMAATINDREIQLRGPCLDVTAVSDSEWGLESLTGCDASLAKYISQLGRLNLLSRDQGVSTPPLPDIFVPTTSLPPSMVHQGLSVPDISVTTDLFTMPTPPRPTDHVRRPSSSAFWTEWFSLRQKLEAWHLPHQRRESASSFGSTSPQSPVTDWTYISPPSSPHSRCVVAPQNVEDVYHISESFRHSAILYSERLAYPDLPSSHPRIQQIVQSAMYHISMVKSDAYLLWPLFITGSECVLRSHRDSITQRCKDISKDSGFFNNLSCLELLEKIWAQESDGTTDDYGAVSHDGTQVSGVSSGPLMDAMSDSYGSSSPLGEGLACSSRGQGFRWHELMQAKRADGEYMVV